MLGSGTFARVYGDPDKKNVYKICLLEKSLKKDPYLQFIKKSNQYNQKNPNNYFFPQVKKISFFKKGKEKFYIVKMERLEFCDPDTLNTQSNDIRKKLSKLFRNRHSVEISQQWNNILNEYKNDQHIHDTLSCVSSLLKKFSNDLHEANMMMRNNGQLVITDPICPKHFCTNRERLD